MSNHLISAVYKRDLRTPMRKSVMALLADKASDDGSGIYASKQTMADELCCSKQAILDTIKAFEAEGLLAVLGTRKAPNGHTIEYGIVTDVLDALPLVKCHADREARRRSTSLTGKPAGPVKKADRSTSVTPPVKQVDPNPPEPSLPQKASPSSVARERKQPSETFLPADFAPQPKPGSITAKAMDAWPPGELEEQLEHFTDHHTLKRTKSADWQASWRTWVKNWKSFNGHRSRPQQRRSSGNPRSHEMDDVFRDLGVG